VANEVSVDLVLKPTSDKAAFSKVEAESKKAGESAGDSFGGGFKSGVASVAKVAAVTAAAAAAAIGLAFKKSIDEAIKQEDAINRLNFALKSTGQFSINASEDLQKFAAQLQQTSRFGDDAVLSAAGLIQQLTALDTQGLKRATKASADFAAFLGGDLDRAASIVAKALEGNVGALSKFGIKVEQGSSKAQTFNNVLNALEGRFSGAAESQINTFSGAVAQLSNSFGDIFKQAGKLIIQNPVIISLIKDANSAFAAAADSVVEFGETFNIINDVVNPLARFNQGVIDYVVAPLELVGNIGRFAFDKIIEGVSAAVAVIGQAGGKIAEFLNKFGVDNNLTKGLQTFSETSTQVFTEAANQADKSFKSIFDTPVAEGLAIKNEELRLKLEERNQIAVEKNQELNTTVADGAKGLGDIFSSIIDQNSFFTQDANKQTVKSLEETNKMTEAFAKKTGAAIQNGIGVAAGNAFAAFGKALAEGENAASAFADAFIQSIGQIAVQQGTAFILQGLAYSFIPGPSQAMAGGLIAAGAALATFGGALSALSGGGKKSAVGGGGIGMSADTQVFSSPQETLSQPDDIAQRSESGPRVQLIVQGDIFNTEDTGNRLIDILNSNFENKGNSFNNARFA
jgi:hypothetical protein